MPGRPGRAEGEILYVIGRMRNLKAGPVRNAKVEGLAGNATFLRSASLNSGSTTCGLRVTGTSYFVRPKCRNERKQQQYRASDYKCALMVLGLETSSELRISDVLRNGQLMSQVSAPFRPPPRARRPRTLQPIAGRGCAKCHVVGRAPSGALRPGTLEQTCDLNSVLWLR